MLNIWYLFVLQYSNKEVFIHISHGNILLMLYVCVCVFSDILSAGKPSTVCHIVGKIAIICSFNGPAMQAIVYLLRLAFPMDHFHESSSDLS